MSLKYILIGIALFILAYFGYVMFSKENDAGQVMDEKGPVSLEAKIGETATGLGVAITPIKVIEDSRCAIDVTCVWAGKVVLRATIASGLGTSSAEFSVGSTITTETEEILLASVLPEPHSSKKIESDEYRFKFVISKR